MQTSIMLKFRPSTVEGKTGSLYLQLIKNRKSRVSVFKGCKIYPNEWDAANESFRLNTGNPQRKIYLENLYAKVTDMKSKIEAIAWEFENLSPGYTLDDLVESFQVKKKGNTLSSFIESEACKLENLHPRTARSYRSVMRKIKQYCPDKDLLLGEITSEFIFRFEQYMRNTGNKLNTTSYYCRNLRAILNRAVREKLIDRKGENPFTGIFTGNEKTIKRAVKKEVIKRLEIIDLNDTEKRHLDQTRWLFLLSYYLRGISFIDMAYLKKENIRDGCICYTRRKTGQYFEIEITPEIKAIFKRYCLAGSSYLLPLLQQGDSRADYENALRKQNKDLKELSALAGLDKPLTTYAARHSWASIAHAMGVPVEIISRGLGHESVKTTQIYLKSFDYDLIHQANRKVISCRK